MLAGLEAESSATFTKLQMGTNFWQTSPMASSPICLTHLSTLCWISLEANGWTSRGSST